jgi:hypothetical protein
MPSDGKSSHFLWHSELMRILNTGEQKEDIAYWGTKGEYCILGN